MLSGWLSRETTCVISLCMSPHIHELLRLLCCGIDRLVECVCEWQRLVECIICILTHCKLLSENTIIEENRHWLVTSGFWTGCSNASQTMRGRSRSSAEWMGVKRVSPPEIHFSQDVIFCQVISKLHSKGRAKKIHSAENYIFKFTYPFKNVMTSHNSRMLACSGQQQPNL